MSPVMKPSMTTQILKKHFYGTPTKPIPAANININVNPFPTARKNNPHVIAMNPYPTIFRIPLPMYTLNHLPTPSSPTAMTMFGSMPMFSTHTRGLYLG